MNKETHVLQCGIVQAITVQENSWKMDVYPFFRTPLIHNIYINIFRQTIPENSWPCKSFCCGWPIKKKTQKTLKYGSETTHGREGVKDKNSLE